MINNFFSNSILIILTITFFIMLTIAFFNRGSAQSYDLLWPLIGGVGAAVFFFGKTFFAPLPIISQKIDFLLVTSKQELAPLSLLVATKVTTPPYDGYLHTYQNFLAYKHNNENFSKKENEISYFDLVEWSTMTWISQQYPFHWQIQRNWFFGISGFGGSLAAKSNAEKEVEKISIVNLLKQNQFVKEYSRKENPDQYIYLPKDTKVKYKKISSGYSILEFRNKNILLNLAFKEVGGGVLSGSDLGEKIAQKIPSGNAKHFCIEFTATPMRARRFSTRTNIQLDWAKELIQFYKNAFSWAILKNNLEKYL